MNRSKDDVGNIEIERKLAISGLHQCVQSDSPIASIYSEIDKLSLIYSCRDVEKIVSACQKKCALHPDDEMRVLIAFGRWLNSQGSTACEGVDARLLSLRSSERPVISASVYALHAAVLCHKGLFQQAIDELDRGFDWLAHHAIENASAHQDLVVASVLLANRVGNHELALQYAYKCHELAHANENAYGIEMANFMVINSTRLAYQGKVNIAFDYNNAIRVVKKDQSQIALVNQMLLPIYAAFAELETEYPNRHAVDEFLAFAKELGALSGTKMCRRAWLLASAKVNILKGREKAAREAVVKSQRYANLFDFKLETEYRQQCAGLRVEPKSAFEFHAAQKLAWRSMQTRVLS